MPVDRDAAFERFLVEDVILTLGNLRGSLGWLDSPEARADAAIYRAGLRRIDRQIELLEDRARVLRASRHKVAAGAGAAGRVDTLHGDPAVNPSGVQPGVSQLAQAAIDLAGQPSQPRMTTTDEEPENVFAVPDIAPRVADDAWRAAAQPGAGPLRVTFRSRRPGRLT
jgi:hypothetical protein